MFYLRGRRGNKKVEYRPCVYGNLQKGRQPCYNKFANNIVTTGKDGILCQKKKPRHLPGLFAAL